MTSCTESVSVVEHIPHVIPVVVIVGPTGSGKSNVAVSLARSLINAGTTKCAEIINADAIQLYKGETYLAQCRTCVQIHSSLTICIYT
jgi:cytidylate kinase